MEDHTHGTYGLKLMALCLPHTTQTLADAPELTDARAYLRKQNAPVCGKILKYFCHA